MIPTFPQFKKLELSDRSDVEKITDDFLPYSDFHFPSLYSWDTVGFMGISKFRQNLVVRFSDYLTSELFLSFTGVDKVDLLARQLIRSAEKLNTESTLKLIPYDTAKLLNKDIFRIEEDKDHCDYIYSVDDLISYHGSRLKTHRNSLSSFKRKHHHCQISVAQIDLQNKDQSDRVFRLHDKWESNKGFIVHQETAALRRYLDAVRDFEYICIGVFIDGRLAGFNINSIATRGYANCMFSNGDTNHYGIYSFLMNESAKFLKEIGFKFINFEQDLGIFNLRKAKEAFKPFHFLKKYRVNLR